MDLDTILMLQDAGMDTERVLRRFGDSSGLYERFLTKFLSDPTFQDVTNAFETEGAQTVLTSTHTFRGLTVDLGLIRFYGISSRMVDCIRRDKFTEASGRYDEPRRAYGEICEILSEA